MMTIWLGLLGCATWAYTVDYADVTETALDDTIEVSFSPSSLGGELVVVNNTSETITVIWNDVSTIQDGVQEKAYKGDVSQIVSELSLPEQSIDPGLRVMEPVYTGRAIPMRKMQRPATVWDYALGWCYGLGIGIGNIAWKPGEDDIASALGDWEQAKYDLIVPVRAGEETLKVKVTITPSQVRTYKTSASAAAY